MFELLRLWLGSLFRIFHTRGSLILENLPLCQQLAALKRRHPKPRLDATDKLFWVVARRFWSRWKDALLLVSPDTVVRWHRAGFQLYWAMLCQVRKPVGGKRISKQIRDLIFQMVVENSTWGAPRIHGELLMLGFDVAERTSSRWMRRTPRNPAPAIRVKNDLRPALFLMRLGSWRGTVETSECAQRTVVWERTGKRRGQIHATAETACGRG